MRRKIISEETKDKMRAMLKAGATKTAVAKEFGVSDVTVYRVSQSISRAKTDVTKAPKFVDIQLNSSSPKVAIIVTEAKDVSAVLAGLWR